MSLFFKNAVQDPEGGALRAHAMHSDQFMRIARVLNRMREDVSRPLDVDALGRLAAMSTSTFHQHFKSVTGTSPLQYSKSLRLHRARLLQFGREFKRLFGTTPGEEASSIRDRLARGVVESRDQWVPQLAL